MSDRSHLIRFVAEPELIITARIIIDLPPRKIVKRRGYLSQYLLFKFIYRIHYKKTFLNKILKILSCPHLPHKKQETKFEAATQCIRSKPTLFPMEELLERFPWSSNVKRTKYSLSLFGRGIHE